MLSDELYEKCEEFFDLIATEDLNEEAETIVETLREYLLDDIDGRTSREDHVIAEEVEEQINSLWNLLPLEERVTNNNLSDYYDEIIQATSEAIDGPAFAPIEDGYDDDEEEEFYQCKGHVSRPETEDDVDEEEEY